MGEQKIGVESLSVDDCRKLLGEGRIGESLIALQALIETHPEDASVQHYMGVGLHMSGRSRDGLAHFDRALELDPNQAGVHQNHSIALLAAGEAEAAAHAARRAIELRPRASGGYINLVLALNRLKHFDEALAAAQKGLEVEPGHAGLLTQAAHVSLELKAPDQALRYVGAALKHAPDHFEAHATAGAILQTMGRDLEAVAEFDWVLMRDPRHKTAFVNRGVALRNLGYAEAAIKHFASGLAFWPDWDVLKYNLAITQLYKGDWLDAWADYELRTSIAGALDKTPVTQAPLWSGEELPDGVVLVLHEQGFGDTFQFLRFLYAARRRVGRLVFICHKRLYAVLSRLDLFRNGGVELRSDADPLPPHDAWLPLMSLPRLTRLTQDNVPIGFSRLAVEEQRLEKWRRFGATDNPKTTWRIGLSWQGNPNAKVDAGRSIPLSALSPLARLGQRARFISLQRFFGVDQPQPEGLDILSPGGDFDAGEEAFVDTATMLLTLDLVITSDTAVAHLAGLLGRPVWLFLKKAPDWRWGGAGNLTPWYPTMRIFRQREDGQWAPLFEEAAADLHALLGELGVDHGERPVQDGIKLHVLGQFKNAILLYGKALAYRRDDGQLLNLNGMAILELGRRSAAAARAGLPFAAHSTAQSPGSPDYWSNLAVLMDSLGAKADAKRALQFALAVKPDHTPARIAYAKKQSAEGESEKAIETLMALAQAEPTNTSVLTTLSGAYSDLRKYREAEREMRKAIELEPKNAKFLVQLGAVLTAAEKHRAAAEAWEQAIIVDPKNADAYSNLGVNERNHGDLGLSLFYQRRAVGIDPQHAEGWNNLGIAELEGEDEAAAKTAFETALKARPGYPDAHLALGMVYLNAADYETGLQHYEWRLKADKLGIATNRPNVPYWTGQDLKGLKFLLMAEQGFGDAFQFCRYAIWLKAQGVDKIYIACRAAIGHLLKTVPGVDGVFGDGEKLPKTDVMAYMMSMPGLTGMRLDTIPSFPSYIDANPERVAKWAEWLALKPGFRIGVVWQGNPDPKVDKGRSYPLSALEPLAKIPGVRLIALQKGAGEEQIEALGGRFEVERPGADFDAGKEAFADTAAMMMNVDLVVTSDTAVAHVAGALGRPCWVVLKALPEWRWLSQRSDSPWYPQTRLFRRFSGEVEATPFAAVMGRMANALEKLVAGDLGQRHVSAPSIPGEIKPFDPVATYTKALEAQRKNDFANSEKGLAAVLGYKKLRPGALHMLGVIALHRDQNSRAAVLFREAEREGETSPEFLTNYSISLRRMSRPDEAIALLARAIAIKPTAEANLSFGNILRDECRFDEAFERYSAAIQLKPNMSKAHRGMGNLMRDVHRPADSLAAFAVARELEGPNADADLVLDHAHAKLFAGDLVGGFRDYEARWGSREMRTREFTAPRWHGAPAPEATLLVHGEQGFGDNIQFVRFVTEAARRVGRVKLEVRQPLLSLFRTLDAGDNVDIVEQGRPLPRVDMEAPMLSLPMIFGTAVDTVPPPPIFRIDPTRIQAWRERFAGKGMKVGMIWQGNPKARADSGRSPPLSALEPFFAIDGLRFISLQKTDGLDQIAKTGFGRDMIVPGADLGDFAETAAAILGLDLVISSCTATLHLAASLGVPTFGLLKYHADWRWLNERSDSPWYPSVTLFRQPTVGDWAGAVAPAAVLLAEMAAGR